MSAAVITGAAQVFPPAVGQRRLWDEHFGPRLAGNRWARRVFLGAGVEQRHAVANPCQEDVAGWSTGARMIRYAAEAAPLGKEAVSAALGAAGVDAGAVGLLAVASCTGYSTPGIDIRVARDVGMGAGVQRLLVGHMGCYAALPALGAVADFVVARRRPAVLLCLELASLHAQPLRPGTDDLEQLVAHALFSDAAAAVVVRPGARSGVEVVDVAARTDAATADHMTWDITDLGFRMGLSRRVPDVLARHVAPLVAELLDRHGVAPDQVDGWAVHPGGPRIVDVVGDRLGLPAGALEPSRRVLARHGNASSATVLVVVEELRRAGLPAPGRYLVALAFGPGLTLYAALLRGRR